MYLALNFCFPSGSSQGSWEQISDPNWIVIYFPNVEEEKSKLEKWEHILCKQMMASFFAHFVTYLLNTTIKS